MFQALIFVCILATGLCQVHNVDDHCKRDCSHSDASKICASDHKTYNNLCEFSVASCYYHEHHRGHLSVVRRGDCPSTFTPRPVVNHCNDLCDEDIMHVCGSDYVVYDNKCKFQRAQCEAAKHNQTLFIVAVGDVCPQRRTPDCTQYTLDTTDLAFEDGTSYTPKCTSRHEYVCASNGRTFSNECVLCSYIKTNKVTVDVVNDAPCLH